MKRKWLTLREAANYLDMTERWLRRQIDEERITNYKIGGQVMFLEADLDQYIERARRPAKRRPSHPPRRAA